MGNPIILIVDDNMGSRETLSDLLSVESYQIETAVDGQSMFAFLEEQLPDVILLDVMMPKINGFEICKMLKESAEWRHIPTVLITALNDRKSLLTGLEAGADEFLSKPISGPELRARVRNMVRLKSQYDALEAKNQLQEELVRIAVHDIRQPLGTIYLHLSTLQYQIRKNPQKKSIDIIDVEARRLDKFIDEFLILLKKDKENLRLSSSAVNLNEMIEASIEENRLLASAVKVQIAKKLPSEEVIASVDRDLFRRVIDNLMVNAIRRSPLGGAIKIDLRRVKTADDRQNGRQGIRIVISDQGTQLPLEHREKIFDVVDIVELKQQDISTPGIGLAFCKMVVCEHSGTIRMEDRDSNGSIIVVDL